MIVLIVTLSRIQGEQNREKFSVYLGKATCQLYTSSGVITMMMTTMGKHTTLNANIELLFFFFFEKKEKKLKKHCPLIMTIIIVIKKSLSYSSEKNLRGPLNNPLHLARSQSCLYSFKVRAILRRIFNSSVLRGRLLIEKTFTRRN